MMILILKNLKQIDNLRSRTALAVKNYKLALCAESVKNKSFVTRFRANFIKQAVVSSDGFVFFVKILFPRNDERFEKFLSDLRGREVAYLIINEVSYGELFDLHSNLLWIESYMGSGSLLIINVSDDCAYRVIMRELLQLEQLTKEGTFNQVRLFLVRENANFISFKSASADLRKLYETKKTKETILLETLPTLTYPALTLGQSLDSEVNSLRLAYPSNLQIVFPFKN